MINLTKIVLINWMYFQKATLPISGNAAIVGINGSGKSTIIDAIQMLLLGNKASKLNQESKIIVMSSNNSIIKPNLFIDEYDVDAVHSATIGKFRKD